MTNESKTLFIPLYGKALMSREGFFSDPIAEEIVEKEPERFTGVDTSHRLAIYMAMRARHYDHIATEFAAAHPRGVVLHLGCGLDSRCRRIIPPIDWYDVDFPDVIALRRAYFPECARYHMIGASVTPADWLTAISRQYTDALILAEGLSMYLSEADMRQLIATFRARFSRALFVFDAYSSLAAKLSRWKNPINAVDAKIDFAMDDPALLEGPGAVCVLNADIITAEEAARLPQPWRMRFRFMGRAGRNLYRIFGYELNQL